jgi:hypothetical protein
MPQLTTEQFLALPPASGQPSAQAQQGPGTGQGAGATGLSTEQFLALPPAPGSPQAQDQAAAAQSDHPVLDNAVTAISRVPGAILGTPRAVRRLASGAIAWGLNRFDHGDRTADSVDAFFPQNPYLAGPTSEQVDDTVTHGVQAADRAVGLPEFQPYKPVTLSGKIGQAALTAGLGGLVDPLADAGAVTKAGKLWQLLRNGAAGGAAEFAADKLAPNSPMAQFLAAAAAHSLLGAAGTTAATTYEAGARPFLRPGAAGVTKAGEAIAETPITGAVASPSRLDVDRTLGDVADITGGVAPGMEPGAAGAQARDFLQSRTDRIADIADEAASPYYDKFRQELATTPPELAETGLLSRPGVRKAMRDAGTDMANLNRPSHAEWVDLNEAGEPTIKGGAYTPDLLQRTGSTLKDMAASARAKGRSQRAGALTGASVDLRDYLYDRYPSLKEADQVMLQRMAPNAPFEDPMVARALSRPPAAFGVQPDYYQQPQQLFDAIAKSSDPGTVMDKFIQAAGGYPASPNLMEPIRQGIIGDLRNKGVIQPNGEFNAKAYDAAVRPYLPTIGMYMPEIGREFENARSAQRTLDTIREQRAVSQDIATGGLRDKNEVITGQSLTRWIDQNEDALERTQSKQAVYRLRQIAKALGDEPGGAAQQAIAEGGPALVGGIVGGADPGILGAMGVGPVMNKLTGDRLAAFHDAYSKAIERAIVDPAYAQEIIAKASRRPRTVRNGRAIREAFGEQALRSLNQGAISVSATSALPRDISVQQ